MKNHTSQISNYSLTKMNYNKNAEKHKTKMPKNIKQMLKEWTKAILWSYVRNMATTAKKSSNR